MLSLSRLNNININLHRNLFTHVRLTSQSIIPLNGNSSYQKSRNYSSEREPKRKSRKFIYLIGLTAVAGGSLLGCSYVSPEFRLQVEESVPQSKDILSMILGPSTLDDKKKKNKDKGVPKPVPVFRKPESPPIEKKQSPPPPTVAPPIVSSSPSPPKKQESTFTPSWKRSDTTTDRLPSQSDVKRKIQEQDHATNQSNNELTEDLVRLIREADATTRKAVQSETQLATKVKAHTEEMTRALNSSDKSAWANVAKALDAKESAKAKVREERDRALNAQAQLKNKIHVAMNKSDTKTNSMVVDAMRQLGRFEYELGSAVFEVHRAQSESEMIVQYRDILEKGRSQFKKDFDGIIPVVDPKSIQGDHMTVEQVNALLIQATERISRLNNRLSDIEAQEKLRVTAALKQQREEDEALLKEKVELEINKLKSQYLVEQQSWDQKARDSWEGDHRQALSLQAALHSDHLTQVMRAQRAEFERDFARNLREHLVKEQEKFQAAVETWTNRVKGIEAAVEGRAEMERQCREAQELWLACQTLYTAINCGEDYAPLPLKRSLEDIRQTTNRVSNGTTAGKSFVHDLINRMPKIALERGVFSEEELLQRFKKVKSVCRRTANIPETGGNILQYFISNVQHWLIFDPSKAFGGEDEIPDDPKPDTYTLLLCAEKAIQKGNMELAVRFLNQLEGYPRLVANDWLSEVRLHLEAKQIARVLMAFAVARGVTLS